MCSICIFPPVCGEPPTTPHFIKTTIKFYVRITLHPLSKLNISIES